MTLFDEPHFGGHRETFAADDPSLADNLLGPDAAGSVRVASGCLAVLYQDDGFEGAFVRLAEDSDDLSTSPVGLDTVSSLKVSCLD